MGKCCKSHVCGSKRPEAVLRCQGRVMTRLGRWQLRYRPAFSITEPGLGGGEGGTLERASGAELNCGKGEGGYISLDTKREETRIPCRWAIEREPKAGEMSELGVPGGLLLHLCAHPLCSLHKEQTAHTCCGTCEFYRGSQRRGQRANVLVMFSRNPYKQPSQPLRSASLKMS